MGPSPVLRSVPWSWADDADQVADRMNRVADWRIVNDGSCRRGNKVGFGPSSLSDAQVSILY